jgi:hypothetical protein
MIRPHYLTTSRGQVRIFVGGDGPTVVVLAGLTRAASAVAVDLVDLLPQRRVIVVEPPGVGGSARAETRSVEDSAETITEALSFLADEAIDLVALELAAGLVPDVADALRPRSTVLVDVDSAIGWSQHGIVPPSPVPAEDGTHLSAFWAFLRDRRLIRPDAPTLPRTSGAPLPDVADLSASFVAAITRPEVFLHVWHALSKALPDALASRSDVRRVAVLAGLAEAIPPPSATVEHSEVPATHAAGNELWHEYIETAFGRAHLRRAGTSGRPVLVLPTGGGSSAQFEPVVRGLAETRTVVALDYFGNGLSDALDRAPTVAHLAREAFAVADALGWDTFDVWGSHTGACTALEMTVSAPERIGRGVYEAPVVISPEFRDDLQANYFPNMSPDAFGTHVQRAWHWRRDVFLYWPWYRVDHAAARAIGLPSAEDLQLYAVGILESGATYDGAYRAAFDYDTRARLPHLTRPAILTAGPHDMLANALDHAADLVPDGLLEVVPTPETVWWPDPEPQAAAETMQIYREFLG